MPAAPGGAPHARASVAPPDGTLLGIAAVLALLVTGGLAASGLLDRASPSGRELALDAGAALVPCAVAAVLLRRPAEPGLRPVTLAVASVGLVVAAVGIGERPSAAPLAVPPTLVLVACRPRLSGLLPRWWRPVGGAALATLLVVGLLASPGAPGGGDPVELVGGTLDDGAAAIGAADARFAGDTVGLADRSPGARCYFVHEGEGEVYADMVACGPVVHRVAADATAGTGSVGDDPDDPGDLGDVGDVGDVGDTSDPGGAEDAGQLPGPGLWDLYAVRVDGGDLAPAGEPVLGQEVEVQLLHRPDGLRPPSDLPEGGGRLTVDPGFAVGLFDEPGRSRPASGFVLAGDGRVTVESLASPSTVADGEGFDREAPDGYRLVAFELTFEEVAGTTLEVVSGSDRVDVTRVVSDSGDSYTDGWVAAVDRDDGIDPLLEVTHRGRSQRISLETGERLGGDPLLYAPRSQTLELPVDSATVPVTVPRPAPHPAEVDVFGYEIVRADLVAFEENVGWAPPGRAWLTVTLSGLDNPSLFDTEADLDDDPIFRFDAAGSFRLRLADGTTVVPSGVQPTPDGDMGAVFAVGEDTRAATFRSAPRWLMSLGTDGIEVAAPAVEVPLAL